MYETYRSSESLHIKSERLVKFYQHKVHLYYELHPFREFGPMEFFYKNNNLSDVRCSSLQKSLLCLHFFFG